VLLCTYIGRTQVEEAGAPSAAANTTEGNVWLATKYITTRGGGALNPRPND